MDEKQKLIKGKNLGEKDVAYLLSLKASDIDMQLLKHLFAFSKDGPPKFSPQDKFNLPKGKLFNKDDITTNVGRYIFNLFMLDTEGLGALLGYINKPLDKGMIGKIDNKISTACCITDKLDIKIYFEYIDKIQWLGYSCNFFMAASMTNELFEVPPKVRKRKEELIAQYSGELAKGNTNIVDKIEKELLELSKNELKDVPDYEIYESGCKGSFSNNYKVSTLMRGTSKNLSTGEPEITTSSLIDGVPPEELHVTGDILVQAPHARAIETAKGGYENKKLTAAFQTVILDNEGSDCKTEKTIKMVLTEKNINDYLYRYMVENGKLVQLTEKNKYQYMGKVVNLRTPLYCKTKQYCNKCVGDTYYKIGIKNVGLTAGNVGSIIMNDSMKSFHNSTISYSDIKNIDKFITPL